MQEILIVEDTESDARLLQRALKGAGVTKQAEWLTTGEEALIYLQRSMQSGSKAPPSIIFVDLNLPRLNGFELLEQLRAQPSFAKTLLVTLSGLDDIQSIKRAYTAGADTFIVKPISAHDIRELINAYSPLWSSPETDDATLRNTVPSPLG